MLMSSSLFDDILACPLYFIPILYKLIFAGEIVPVHITLELMKIKMENEIEKKKKKKEEKGQSKKRQEEEELSQKKQDKEEEKEEKKKSFSFKILDENVLLKNINIEEYNKKLKYENCIYENKEVLKILKKNKINEEAKYKFIIDGFPRNYDNFDGWMSIIGNYAYVHLCLFLYCDDDNMIERCINRGLISGNNGCTTHVHLCIHTYIYMYTFPCVTCPFMLFSCACHLFFALFFPTFIFSF